MELLKIDVRTLENLPVFFILGRPRSGTSLLRIILDAHPNIQIPIESPVILDSYQKFGKIANWNEKIILEFYQNLFRLRRFDAWRVNAEKLKNDLLECNGVLPFQSLCKVVHLNYISVFEKDEIKIIGDKNPQYSLHPELILSLYPQAKIIHITRDYRDHYLSMKRAGFLRGQLPFIIYYWKRTEKKIQKIRKQNPGNVFTFRYENLVENPHEVLKSLFLFLDVPYTSAVLDYHLQKDKVKQIYPPKAFDTLFSGLLKPINSDSINRWKNEMDEKQIKTADYIVGKIGENAGYKRAYRQLEGKDAISILKKTIFVRLMINYQKFKNIMPSFVRKGFEKVIPGPYYLYEKLFKD
ncbi:MAG: sulfotransferase [Bacteroidales bacterium]|nr:sulfotransferase [Bacteroidales bacterium]MCF8404528.1 sulfotransferase [Bacteroidales bacterium]